ncbi:NAD(P)/FAD-dependent oxidoreductase [Phenylobacterium deserti]|uniref:Thioredoxin reductase n=1 Tax=Phenylobacterium deserti TaxID=1914756 RepID=A0A328AQU9_9CAUL|nr:NAD(P)/FAD-dependent oxidoreductase [Phenylobacterium deserti]RAK56959.1 NAD(P)/FAD-dependent oxidoreductase [Phenylobacterium deserti]
MPYDAIIVGGSFAGLSAAMQLVRARRRILMIDAGQPRNRFAEAAHGFLGQDGVAPATLMREGLRQLSAYPTFDFVHGAALEAAHEGDQFEVRLSDGVEVSAARLVLATGVSDELPLPSMAPRWGVSVLHCPYCHGYEVRDRPIAVIANHPAAAHQGLLLPDWGPTTYFTQGQFEPTAEEAAQLSARGVAIERTPVVELLGEGAATEALRLADGRIVAAGAVFTAPKTRLASPLAEQLGCAMADGMTGPHIQVDELKRTSVEGVFAAGDAAQPMHNATLASAAGVMAGVSAHRSLVMAAAV